MSSTKYFFSYSRQNSEFVIKLATDLKNAGLNVWLDQLDISPGTAWDESIESALNESTGALVILSPAAIKSKNVMDEVSFAIRQNKKVIPLMIEQCKVPLRIDRLQHIDFTGDYDKGLQRLIKAINSGEATKDASITSQPAGKENSPMLHTTNLPPASTGKSIFLKPAVLVPLVVVVVLFLVYYFAGNGSSETNSDESYTAFEMERKGDELVAAKDFQHAIEWYKKAADSGRISSMQSLAWIYNTDLKNMNQAIAWYTKCAEKANTECMWRLGYILCFEKGNFNEGAKWLQRSAEGNDSEGALQLAYIYLSGGENFKKDEVQAAYWFEKSMEGGNATAKGQFGMMLYEGAGGLLMDKKNGKKLIAEAFNATNDSTFSEYLKTH